MPNVQLSEVRGAHRLLHIHKNQPGVLAGINRVVADHGLNILAQSLKTREDVGYVITDVDRTYDRGAVDALRDIPGTLKVRLVY
jgi:D-3-phosphoglycerate dehydrogenase